MNPSTKQHMKLPVNVHYHATVACIKMKDQKFEPTNIIIPDTLKEKLMPKMYCSLFYTKIWHLLLSIIAG